MKSPEAKDLEQKILEEAKRLKVESLTATLTGDITKAGVVKAYKGAVEQVHMKKEISHKLEDGVAKEYDDA